MAVFGFRGGRRSSPDPPRGLVWIEGDECRSHPPLKLKGLGVEVAPENKQAGPSRRLKRELVRSRAKPREAYPGPICSLKVDPHPGEKSDSDLFRSDGPDAAGLA